MKQDSIKPDYYTYNLLINGCARVGYCKKAFKLYTQVWLFHTFSSSNTQYDAHRVIYTYLFQMKKTGVKRTAATYTGLFNACATSPDPEDGLMRLNNLRAKLDEARVTLTLINYNAMMKGTVTS
jgi:pentatricopeptide repeat protein